MTTAATVTGRPWAKVGRVLFLLVRIAFVLGLVTAAALTAFGTYFAATLPPRDPSISTWRLVVLVAALATAGLGLLDRLLLAIARGSRQKELKAARLSHFAVLDGPLVHLAGQVNEMAAGESNDRQQVLEGIRQSAIRGACEVVGSDNPRATYFRVEVPDATHRVLSAAPKYNYGPKRHSSAVSRFVEGSGPDQEVWGVLDTGVETFYGDLDKKHPPTMDMSREREYRCFVTMRVHVGEIGVGLLTVNTAEKRGLEPSDLSALRAIAELLSVAEAAALTTNALHTLATADKTRLDRKVAAKLGDGAG